MPHYEYKCPDCSNIVVLKRRVDDRNDPVLCENKGAHPQEKVYMAKTTGIAGFSLKGSGWAKDGYGG